MPAGCDWCSRRSGDTRWRTLHTLANSRPYKKVHDCTIADKKVHNCTIADTLWSQRQQGQQAEASVHKGFALPSVEGGAPRPRSEAWMFIRSRLPGLVSRHTAACCRERLNRISAAPGTWGLEMPPKTRRGAKAQPVEVPSDSDQPTVCYV